MIHRQQSNGIFKVGRRGTGQSLSLIKMIKLHWKNTHSTRTDANIFIGDFIYTTHREQLKNDLFSQRKKPRCCYNVGMVNESNWPVFDIWYSFVRILLHCFSKFSRLTQKCWRRYNRLVVNFDFLVVCWLGNKDHGIMKSGNYEAM